MDADTKTHLLVLGPLILAVGAAVWLAWFYQPPTDRLISVSLTTPGSCGNGEKAKIVLKAGLNGAEIPHGKVRVHFIPVDPKRVQTSQDGHRTVEGYTDDHGVFAPNWVPALPGEYMVAAAVSKPGCLDGRSVCFVRVNE